MRAGSKGLWWTPGLGDVLWWLNLRIGTNDYVYYFLLAKVKLNTTPDSKIREDSIFLAGDTELYHGPSL